eukprot:TRINITY_DN525_c0_g1_i2.p1 TRINITY_DN525_c0_g1~~TRINITY_DN525_c0_g1_i2.p1  ORF type:complete len:123 (-),score=20.24 TRINITY_DN525_c0_g1_i2:6-374(-)
MADETKILVQQALQLDQDRVNYKLRSAAYIGNDAEVQDCLSEGANPNGMGKDGTTALHSASQKGFVKVVRLLLQYGANSNIKNPEGKTALELATAAKHHDVIHALNNLPKTISKPKNPIFGQ